VENGEIFRRGQKKAKCRQGVVGRTCNALEGEAMIEFISQHVGDAAMFIGFLVCAGILARSGEANEAPHPEPSNSYDL
jgi:hypothetical protein